MMEIFVREMLIKDAGDVNSLSHQLGYPLSLEQTSHNIKNVLQNEEHTAFVAEYESRIIGWIGASQALMIEMMPHCEINGLVIDENHRGKGVGKMLIESVKKWAKQNGNNKLCIHTNIKRTEAHSFYEHLGFKEQKQQKYMVIDI